MSGAVGKLLATSVESNCADALNCACCDQPLKAVVRVLWRDIKSRREVTGTEVSELCARQICVIEEILTTQELRLSANVGGYKRFSTL